MDGAIDNPFDQPAAVDAVALEQALAAVTAARAILRSRRCQPESAKVHLELAIHQVLQHGDARVATQCATRIRGSEWNRPTGLDVCDHLEGALQRILRTHGLRRPKTPSRWRWLGRTLAWLALPVAAVVIAAKPWQALSQGPWRGIYYPTVDLQGQPIVRNDPHLEFEWNREAPMDTVPGDLFSVTWDTCLRLDRDRKVTWQMVFDDGARFYVDGELLLDGWERRDRQSMGKSSQLSKGDHHLRVEYVDHHAAALIHLLASFAGEVPRRLPEKWLKPPSGDLSDVDPCRLGRSTVPNAATRKADTPPRRPPAKKPATKAKVPQVPNKPGFVPVPSP